MKPNASLKSLKTKVRSIASRPAASLHPLKPFSADLRASADIRSITASLSQPLYVTPIDQCLIRKSTTRLKKIMLDKEMAHDGDIGGTAVTGGVTMAATEPDYSSKFATIDLQPVRRTEIGPEPLDFQIDGARDGRSRAGGVR